MPGLGSVRDEHVFIDLRLAACRMWNPREEGNWIPRVGRDAIFPTEKTPIIWLSLDWKSCKSNIINNYRQYLH